MNPLTRKNAGQRREIIDYEGRCPSNRLLKWGHKRDASGSFPSRNSGIRRRKEGNDWKSISDCTLLAFFNLDLVAFFLELEYQIHSVVCSLQTLKVKTNWTLKLVFFCLDWMLGGLAAAYFNAKGFHTEVGLMVSQLLQRVNWDKETVDLCR